ncbi:MAG: hypothetical protein ABFS14_08665 [Gemmatimonadota bacterium]
MLDAPALHLLIGYLGSALVVCSLAMRSILRLRIIGLAGAVTFTAYGYLIGAWPVVLTNVVIVVIHLHFLREIVTAEEYFKILEVRPDSRYIDYFLHHYGPEIEATWPDFSYEASGQRLTLFILRDLVPAGLFIAEIEDETTLRLCLDFAIPGYRDFKIGRYLYSRGALRDRGFRTVVAGAGPDRTTQYLRRVGFRADPDYGPSRRLVLMLEPQ